MNGSPDRTTPDISQHGYVPASGQTLTAMLRWRAFEQPDRVAIAFHGEQGGHESTLTYGQLDNRARAVAAWMQQAGLSGERVILLLPPGLDFIVAFAGCMYAGAVAVPAYPPRAGRSLNRLEAIVGNADIALAIGTAEMRADFDRKLGHAVSSGALQWMVLDELAGELARDWSEPGITPETLAVLQYTSGSTAEPKGVMLSHRNLMHNLEQIGQLFEHTASSQGVIWLPPYHDMGLVGGILEPLYAGFPVTLMSPITFLQKPLRWLQAVSRWRATTSGGPDFAYELCVRQITAAQRDELDLSSWQVAFCGAEPIRSRTLERFAEYFAPCGFRWEAFFPCYGLAESTLIASGGRRAAPPVLTWVARTPLEQDQVVVVEPPARDARCLVGCGPAISGHEIAIVSPETGARCPPGQPGEIWIAGPSVAQGYWGRPEQSASTFGARIADTGEGPFLRTGDLGFLLDGELYITGRSKDLIVVRGRNLHPHDIEQTSAACHPELQPAGAAAFTIESDGVEGEQLVVLQEARLSRAALSDPQKLVNAIRVAVAAEHDLAPSAVVLVDRMTLPKTSSGKIQRYVCKAEFVQGRLRVIAQWREEPPAARRSAEPEAVAAPSRSREDIAGWLATRLANHLGCDAATLDQGEPFVSYGVDSRQVIHLVSELEQWLGQRLDPVLVYRHPTIAALADHLASMSRQGSQAVARVRAERGGGREPIAITGIGCRFPGASGPGELWEQLESGVDAIREVPPDRWSVDEYYDPDLAATNKMNTRWGGFLRDIDMFDPLFFGISPREATQMDPQQRLLLEVAWEALEDAGELKDRLHGTQLGVFVGISNSDYSRLPHAAVWDVHAGTGNALCIAANRLSYVFGLRGPSLAVDTACSSSLVALHLACRSMWNGESTAALVAGVNVILLPELTASFSKAGFMAPDGRCKTFDAGANGYVRGEGCGVVMLKRLSDAIASGDRIYAVIRGTASNNDGRTNGLTAPNPQAQEQLLRACHADAGVDPDAISYIEAHGTGTALGDRIELAALGAALGVNRGPDRSCAIGSIKTNIGHLEAAAGIAGVIKTALSLHARRLVKSLHCNTPCAPLATLPLHVQRTTQDWVSDGARRLAGVSAFGFGGTNAHAVLEEAPPHGRGEAAAGDGRALVLTISARSEPALRALTVAYRDALAAEQQAAVDVCYTTNLRRTHHEHRLAVAGATAAELVQSLDPWLRGEPSASVHVGTQRAAADTKLCFLFTGQGSPWPGMGRDLFASEPVYRAALESCEAEWRNLGGGSLIDAIHAPEDRTELGETHLAQPAIFAVQVALTSLYRDWGIEPTVVVGHSVGEVAAAWAAGILSLRDAVRVVRHRGELMQRARDRGAMAAVRLSPEGAAPSVARHAGALAIAAINGPRSVVLSGDVAVLEQELALLAAHGVLARRLAVHYAFHSAQMAEFQDELVAALRGIQPRAATTAMISAVTGEEVAGPELDGSYWARGIVAPVVFSAAVTRLAQRHATVAMEVGPQPMLLRDALDVYAALGQPLQAIPTLRNRGAGSTDVRSAVAALHARGVSVRWDHVTAPGQLVRLPTYPWQRERYWLPVRSASGASAGPPPRPNRGSPILGSRLRSPLLKETVFESSIGTRTLPILAGHRILQRVVFPASGFFELALAAAVQAFPETATLREVRIHAPLVLPDGIDRTVQIVLDPVADGGSAFRVFALPAAHDAEAPAGAKAAVDAWTLLAEGKIHLGGGVDAPSVALAAAQAACPGELERDRYYDQLATFGLEYEGSFRAIDRLWQGNEQAVARIRMPESPGTGGFHLHPAILDAAFQLILASLPDDLTRTADGVTYVPVGAAQVCRHAPIDDAGGMWAHVIRRTDAPALAYDVRLCDDNGAVVASVLGLRLERIAGKPVVGTRPSPAEELYELHWQDAESRNEPAPETTPGTWLVLSEHHGLGQSLIRRLRLRGERAIRVIPGDACQLAGDEASIDPRRPEHLGELLGQLEAGDAPIRGIAHLWSLDAALADSALGALDDAQRLCAQSVLHLLPELARRSRPPRLVLVAHDVDADADAEGRPPASAGVASSTLWGLGAVIAFELPGVRCARVLVDPDTKQLEDDAAILFAELDGRDGENAVAIRLGARKVARLVRRPAAPGGAAVPPRPYALDIGARGVIDNLVLQPAERRELALGEVEVEVAATGVNFRDVMNALGLYPGDAGRFGGECAGTVTRVGAGVTAPRPGDHVLGVGPGCFDSHVITAPELLVAKPAAMSFEEAAAIPVAFLTAWYALRTLGKLTAGDRVLIHSGAGGVGMAALRIARMVGAEVFATAGTPDKRERVKAEGAAHVFESRDLRFADAILEATGGEGVDVVLNSLPGEYIDKSFSVLRRGGRFLEIGKIGIWEPARVAELDRAVDYHIIDLAVVFREQRTLIGSLLADIMAAFETGALTAIPHRVFPLAKLTHAFRHMAQARHVGKIVVSHDPEVAAIDRPIALAADAMYLITGGFGALGLRTARWMVEHGARHLMLVSRRGIATELANELAALEAGPARIVRAEVDISDRDQVARLLASVRISSPPLRGIVHAAGVLDDGLLANQTWERFASVLAPKLQGAWNLHALTRSDPLDFFVLYSSVASVLGSPGQGPYAAANSFLDALARHRRALGLPGLSINWGPWAGAGMAQKSNGFAALGIEKLEPERAMAALDRLLADATSQAAVLAVDWNKLARGFPGALPPLLGGLAVRAATEPLVSRDLLARLYAASPTKRNELMSRHLREQVARVLDLGSPDDVGEHQGLFELGIDSLMAVELKNRVEATFGCQLAPSAVFDYPTIKALSGFLLDQLFAAPEQPPAPPVIAEPAGSTQLLHEIQGMSDDELSSLIDLELSSLIGGKAQDERSTQ
jgi:acyl transferase domain-containing protein/acyl-CoA synthetase (AMP-forming)/AMP-acid ligase II/acyl carrier protein